MKGFEFKIFYGANLNSNIRNTMTYKEPIVPIQSKMKNQLQKYNQKRGVMEN